MARRRTPRAWLEARVETLEAELAASKKTTEALIGRLERQRLPDTRDQFAVIQAMASLEEAVAARTRELAASEAHFRGLFEHSPNALLTTLPDGRIRDRNAAARSLGPAEHLAELFASPEACQALIERGFVGAAEREYMLRDGRRVLLTAVPVEEDGGPVHHVSLKDVSAHRALEDELDQSRRLAGIGRLVAGVANEINNPLSVILGRLEFLGVLDAPSATQTARHLGVITDHAQRIAEFVGTLEILAQPGPGTREVIALSALLERAQRLYAPRLGRIQVQRRLPEVDLHLWGDIDRLAPALSLLIVDLGELLRGRGRLDLSARAHDSYCRIELRSTGLSARGGGLQTLIGGDGEGGPGRLSLELVALILSSQGGGLALLPGSDGILLELPLAADASAASDAAPDAQQPLQVLVVEDELAVAELIADLLQTDGHAALLAPDVAGALAALQARDGEVDVVLCDLVLPGDSGVTLREAVARRWPQLLPRFVMMSGLPNAALPVGRSLRKPFSRRDLTRLLTSLV